MSKMFVNIITIIFLFLNYSNCEVQPKYEIPSFIKICHRSDPEFSECLKESVNSLKPMLKNGIPELDIPSCEPFYIPELIVDQGTGAVNIKSKYKDIYIYGPSNFVLKSVKVDFTKDRCRIRLWIPELQMESTYSMEGRIMLMPISGSGHSVGNFSNIEATATMQAEKIIREDDEYYNIKDFFLQFQIGNATIQLDDLFGGDKLLGTAMNVFLNNNWDVLLKDIQPVLEDKLADMFKEIGNKIYSKFPITTLFPL